LTYFYIYLKKWQIDGLKELQEKEEDHDDEEEEKIEEEADRDDSIIGQIAEAIGILAKFNKATFAPLFQQLLPPILLLLSPTCSASDRQAAICIFDDLVEFSGPLFFPYFQHFFPLVMEYAADADPHVRQAAVYGLGVCAQVGGEKIVPAIQDILQRLTQVVLLPDSRDSTFGAPTDNAIAAVGKVIKFHSNVVDVSKVLPLWLSWLPVKQDPVESKITYNLLCDWVESSNVHLFGAQFQQLPKILGIFGDILGTELIDEQLTTRIVNILKQLRGLQPDVLQKSWNLLTEDQKQKLQSSFAS